MNVFSTNPFYTNVFNYIQARARKEQPTIQFCFHYGVEVWEEYLIEEVKGFKYNIQAVCKKYGYTIRTVKLDTVNKYIKINLLKSYNKKEEVIV